MYQIAGIEDSCGKLKELGDRINVSTSQVQTSAHRTRALRCYSCRMGLANRIPPEPPPEKDPRRNLFWMYISFLGISIPKPGQERRAFLTLIMGVILFLAFIAVGILTIFDLW